VGGCTRGKTEKEKEKKKKLQFKDHDTRTQYTSANITLPPQEHFVSAQNRHLDTSIANAILKKGTRNSYGQ
jgi:hypothetical protein